ncbi:hypothetical protein MB02_12635 [Croceicoccus estronivorus]|uniref:ketopantoate reductase family protein n=1 Tax=Croceicoccus estronivorus TaxID=1172626 RepID=UPI000834604B|nr:2-dehydropantoate 2-reductase [Croceicoccus estronivorus]OCC23447.1 hypothetical protein MB02_12635 [Croceicoccus estronivorus]
MARIVIIGAGALGRFFAASLADAGYDVVMVAREPGFTSLRSDGVQLYREGVHSHVRVAVRQDCLSIPDADLVLVCTKAADLTDALELAAPLASVRPGIVTVQNGVEAPIQVMTRFPAVPVIASRVHGFFEVRMGVVHHVGVAPSLAFGLVSQGGQEVVDLFQGVLAKCGIGHKHSTDIWRDLWEKFLLAASLGGVGTALRCDAGRIKETDEGQGMLADAMNEIAGLAEMKGIALGTDCVARTLAFVNGFPPDATTSMQRDIESGRQSEYDCLTGAVLRMARECGLDVPIHERIEQKIQARGLLRG